MNLRFETPHHGWMFVRLGGRELVVSDVPCDSLFHLTTILSRLISGSSSESVEWSLEPEYAKWIFERNGTELEFYLRETSRAEPILIERASPDLIIDQIIAALAVFADDPCWQEEDVQSRIWSWTFPSNELERLKTKRAEQGGGHRRLARRELKI